MGDTGELSTVGFNFCLQQQQQMMTTAMRKGFPSHPLHQQQQNVSTHQPSSANGFTSADVSYQIACLMENQKRELNRLLQKQNENLLLALKQQRKRHLGALAKMVESKASALLRQKEEEVEKANRRMAELMNHLQRTQLENAMWQRIARDQEAAVLHLSNSLELVQRQNYHSGSNRHQNPGATQGGCDGDGVRERQTSTSASSSGSCSLPTRGTMCRGCNSHEPNVLLFPCRHLCFCSACADLFDSCPICRSVKQCCIGVLVP